MMPFFEASRLFRMTQSAERMNFDKALIFSFISPIIILMPYLPQVVEQGNICTSTTEGCK
jgi:hypothetical protein